jgi:hypothetical protein
MASFDERAQIIRNSKEPADRTDYAESRFIDSSLTDIRNAVLLRRRITAALSDIASEIRENYAAGQAQNPPVQLTDAQKDQAIWARDYRTQDADTAFEDVLNHFDSLTVADFFNINIATDAAIRAFLLEFAIPALAAGVANKRR